MALWEYLGAWASTTKWLYHLNWDATDSSWNGNNGMATNISWTWGKIWSGSATWNWSSSRITFTRTWAWSNNTYAVWFKRNWNWTWENQLAMFWWTSWTKWTAIRCQTTTLQYLNSNYSAWQTIQTISNWIWYHLVITQDWSWSKAYINWSLIVSNSDTSTLWWTQLSAFLSNWNAAQDYFNWVIDEVIIEARTWTAEEVKKQYTAQRWLYIL